MVSEAVVDQTLPDDPTLEDGDDALDGDGEQERSGEDTQPDPLDTLRTELNERIEAETRRVRSELEGRYGGEVGRAQKLEKRLDDALSTLTAQNSPGITDEAVSAIVSALVASDLIDDQSRASLRTVESRLAEAKTKRERDAIKREVLAEAQTAVTPEREPEPQQQSPEAVAATNRVVGYADARGVDPTRIPQDAWNLLPGETLPDAVTRLRKVIDGLAADSSSGARVAERRGAAGSGSPGRGGGGNVIEQDLRRLETEGIPLTDEQARRRVAAELGVDL